MAQLTCSELEKLVIDHYLESDDFNGISFFRLNGVVEDEPDHLVSLIKDLLEAGRLTVQSERWNPNPSVKLLGDWPIKEQLAALQHPRSLALYPVREAVEKRTADLEKYVNQPYSHRLALCEAQLQPVFFEPEVLERYRQDPRYDFQFPNCQGRIYGSDDSDNSQNRIFIQSFGLGYSPEGYPLTVVFLRYLHDLNERHQRHWQSFAYEGNGVLSRPYFDSSIRGEFPETVDIYTAFLREQEIVNKMCTEMGRENLFRVVYERDRPRPLELSHFLLPTLKNYHDFVHTLDKLMSDNINKKFFAGEIPTTEVRILKDGSKETIQLGTIVLLSKWLAGNFSATEPDFIEKSIIAGFKEVRKIRQEPAHRIHENEYSKEYWEKQRDLMRSAYRSVRSLRLAFANHPAASLVQVPEWLYEGAISDH